MSQVIIGMDPHKRSATIEVMTADETVAGGGRYRADASGLAVMLAAVRRWPERAWAVEGSRGTGRQLASWLVAAGERVVDVPPKLSARTRVFTAGQGRKTDATDAHSVALAATRMHGLRPVANDQQLAVLRIFADRRRCPGEDHTKRPPGKTADPAPGSAGGPGWMGGPDASSCRGTTINPRVVGRLRGGKSSHCRRLLMSLPRRGSAVAGRRV